MAETTAETTPRPRKARPQTTFDPPAPDAVAHWVADHLVTVRLSAEHTGGVMSVVETLVVPGGGPPPTSTAARRRCSSSCRATSPSWSAGRIRPAWPRGRRLRPPGHAARLHERRPRPGPDGRGLHPGRVRALLRRGGQPGHRRGDGGPSGDARDAGPADGGGAVVRPRGPSAARRAAPGGRASARRSPGGLRERARKARSIDRRGES